MDLNTVKSVSYKICSEELESFFSRGALRRRRSAAQEKSSGREEILSGEKFCLHPKG